MLNRHCPRDVDAGLGKKGPSEKAEHALYLRAEGFSEPHVFTRRRQGRAHAAQKSGQVDERENNFPFAGASRHWQIAGVIADAGGIILLTPSEQAQEIGVGIPHEGGRRRR